MFVAFDESGRLDAPEMEVRRILGATLETPARILRQNIHAYRAAAEAYSDERVLDFLSACESIVAI